MNDMIMAIVTTGVAGVVMVIAYIIEAVFLSRIALKYGENPLLAWIPVANYFLIRKMANKKSRWQWLVAFLAAAILGRSIVSWVAIQALVWSMMIWYWVAFYNIMEAETDFNGLWTFFALICWPVKIYIMYKMAE